MGSYVFIDMFLGILFVLSTGSILYYKQLTEAFADRGRYSILRKIGTKKKELHPQVTLNIVCSSYFDMTFAEKNFDLVISTYSFYHFTAQL